MAVYDQLTEMIESDETAGYPQLKNCGGFDLINTGLEEIQHISNKIDIASAVLQWGDDNRF